MKPAARILFLLVASCPVTRAQRHGSIFCPSSHQQNSSVRSDPHSFRFRQELSLFMLESQPLAKSSVPPAGVVPARQLLILPKAIKEFARGRKAYVARDFQGSAHHWESALRVYPDFPEARNNLGSSYLMIGDYEKSRAEFEKAIALDAKLIEPYNNLSLALLLLDRYPDSELAARQALQIDPRDLTSLNLLGQALAAQQHYTQEAVDSLRQSRNQNPASRLILVQVLQKRGEVDQAVAELRDYLQVATGTDKQKAQCWLALLTHEGGVNACGARQKTN